MRVGIITKKLGMTRVFDEKGQHIPVTVLQMDNCQVVCVKENGNNGHNYVQVGAFNHKLKNISKPLRGYFAKQNVQPKKVLVDFKVNSIGDLKPGDEISMDHFLQNQKVDVMSYSKGRGFAGVIKRHNFGGGRASHGNSLAHRTPGSTGQCQDPGRVFKGKKMPGHMGDVRVTKQNLSIVKVDTVNNLLFVKGGVPGAKGAVVIVRDSVKNPNKGFDLVSPAVVKSTEGMNTPELAN